jgi:hypothetical protein
VTALPATGSGGDGGAGIVVGIIAGLGTFGLLLAGSRFRAMRAR